MSYIYAIGKIVAVSTILISKGISNRDYQDLDTSSTQSQITTSCIDITQKNATIFDNIGSFYSFLPTIISGTTHNFNPIIENYLLPKAFYNLYLKVPGIYISIPLALHQAFQDDKLDSNIFLKNLISLGTSTTIITITSLPIAFAGTIAYIALGRYNNKVAEAEKLIEKATDIITDSIVETIKDIFELLCTNTPIITKRLNLYFDDLQTNTVSSWDNFWGKISFNETQENLAP